MKMKNKKPVPPADSPEQISPVEALNRMKGFSARKEKFVAAIKESKDRNLPARKK
jgi:hypothetical protein